MFKNVLAAHVQTRIAQALAVVIRAITAAAVITIVTVAVSDLVRHVHAHHAHVHLDLVHHVHALHAQVVKTAAVHNIASV